MSVMKKRICVVLLAIVSLSLYAEKLLTEDFEYEEWSLLTECGWTLQWGGASGFYVDEGLQFTGYAGCGVGGGIPISGRSGNDQPHKAFSPVSSGDVYVALLFRADMVSKAGYFFSLRDNLIDNNTFHYMGRICIDDEYHLGLAFGDTQSAVYAAEPINTEQAYLLVLRYRIVAGEANDEVALYCYATFPTSQGTPVVDGVCDATQPDIAPANVVLRGFDPYGLLYVDGIRVATSWSDAVEAGSGGCVESALQGTRSLPRAAKILRDGHLLIERDGYWFDILGTECWQ